MNLFSESRSDSTPKLMVTGNDEGDNGSNTVKSRRRAFVGNEKERRDGKPKNVPSS